MPLRTVPTSSSHPCQEAALKTSKSYTYHVDFPTSAIVVHHECMYDFVQHVVFWENYSDILARGTVLQVKANTHASHYV